ncbi:dolichol kinase [Anopheles nili]|uniref:dolichol kinase n=1 Tax=Anopheles nili TaxID=185578 RepID=UPI00237C1B4E|nr:dolichol kinase [Anopheles nili]
MLALYGFCLGENMLFCAVAGLLPILLYDTVFFMLFRTMPKSFTLGEASVVSQGYVLFTYFSLLQLPPAIVRSDGMPSDMQAICYILQLGLLATRKVFHFLIVLVYGPGLWYQCRLLYLTSGLMLALLVVLEIARLIQLFPVAGILNSAVNLFIDEKDSGAVALTPIYLLVGCSLPLWLHPSPCDLTNSGGLQMLTLLAGVLSIGIGDTAASVVGYYFGKHKWSGDNKSVEGTIASVLLQVLTVSAMYWIGMVHLTVSRGAYAGIAIIVNSLIESRTDQIDNLVLPLVTYLILICSP